MGCCPSKKKESDFSLQETPLEDLAKRAGLDSPQKAVEVTRAIEIEEKVPIPGKKVIVPLDSPEKTVKVTKAIEIEEKVPLPEKKVIAPLERKERGEQNVVKEGLENVPDEKETRIYYFQLEDKGKKMEEPSHLFETFMHTVETLKAVTQNDFTVFEEKLDTTKVAPKNKVKELIEKFSHPQKSSQKTLRQRTSALEKEERMKTLDREIRERKTPGLLKKRIETMEEVYEKCEVIMDF